MRRSDWQVSFPPLFRYYTDHSQLSKALYSIKWSWLLLCCMEWYFFNLLMYFTLLKIVGILLKIKVPYILYLLVIFCVVILVLRSSWKQIVAWYWKSILMFVTAVLAPIIHRLWGSAVCWNPVLEDLTVIFHVCDFTTWLRRYSAYISNVTTRGARDWLH
jgi:hypothetical protein